MSVALLTAPAVPISAADGMVRSSSNCPKASMRQSRQPARINASAEASRCAGVGGGGVTGASGGRAHPDNATTRTRPAVRIEPLDPVQRKIALSFLLSTFNLSRVALSPQP